MLAGRNFLHLQTPFIKAYYTGQLNLIVLTKNFVNPQLSSVGF